MQHAKVSQSTSTRSQPSRCCRTRSPLRLWKLQPTAATIIPRPVDEGMWLPYRAPAGASPHGASLAFGHHMAGDGAGAISSICARTTARRQNARSGLISRLAWISLIVSGVLVATILTTTVGAAASYYVSQQPSIAALNRTVASKDSVRIYDDQNKLIYQFSNNGLQHSIPLAKIPVDVINATVAIEDHSFWVNQGIDLTSIGRAATADLQNGAVTQGGSTITQQLIKNEILNDNTTFDRKLREAILAVGITETGAYSKSQILEMYLNSVPYGALPYGIDAAAQFYFGYSDNPTTGQSAAQHLDLAQASITGRHPAESEHQRSAGEFRRGTCTTTASAQRHGHLWLHHAGAGQCRLRRVRTAGFLPAPKQYAESRAAFRGLRAATTGADGAIGQLDLTRSGLNVYTTLDLNMQNATQQAMKNHLYGADRDDYTHNLISNDHVTNAAGLMVQQSTGDIKVMLGSVDYYSNKIPGGGQFNVVTDGYRGPGSSFKPIVYATAFQKGWAPAMTISDMPTVFWDAGAEKPYKPLDFNFQDFWGTITLRNALQNSLNIPAVKVMQFAGVQDVETQRPAHGHHELAGRVGPLVGARLARRDAFRDGAGLHRVRELREVYSLACDQRHHRQPGQRVVPVSCSSRHSGAEPAGCLPHHERPVRQQDAREGLRRVQSAVPVSRRICPEYREG